MTNELIERLRAEAKLNVGWSATDAADALERQAEAAAKLVEALARISVRPVKGAKDLNELRFSARQALTAYEGAARHGSE